MPPTAGDRYRCTARKCPRAGSPYGLVGPRCATRSGPGPSAWPTLPCAMRLAIRSTPCIPPGNGNARSTRPAKLARRCWLEGRHSARASTGTRARAGYVGYLGNQGASATWSVMGAPAGRALVSIRYSNEPSAPLPSAQSTIDLLVNGRLITTLVAAPTDSANPWSTLHTTVPLQSGTNAVAAVSGPNNFNLGIDSLSSGRRMLLRPSRSRPTPWADGSGVSTPSPTARARRARRAPPGPSARQPRAFAHGRPTRPARLASWWTTATAAIWTRRDGSSPGSRAATARTATCSSTGTTTRAHCAPSPS